MTVEAHGNGGMLSIPMIDPEIVRQIRTLAALKWGARRIAAEVGVAKNSVKRYLRGGDGAAVQRRPRARKLDDEALAQATALLRAEAAGNTVVVQRLMAEAGTLVSLRTLQRRLAPHRQAQAAAALATVRFETAPGAQLQIDFGEKTVLIGGQRTRVHLFVAVLGYSRRIFVRASLAQRQDDWREGLAGAFTAFGGVTQSILIDRAGALVLRRPGADGGVQVHPAFASFCRDFGVAVSVCKPYRARTKGKTESGVGYVKRNGLAGQSFASFAALQAHLVQWMALADQRIHGTTRARPADRFAEVEAAALRPLPRALPIRQRRLERRVANDCFVDVDTIRYSVPHAFVKRTVEVLVGDDEVAIFEGSHEIARHPRGHEPYARHTQPAHFAGLFRTQHHYADAPHVSPIGRSLDIYAAAIGGAP